MVYPAIDMTGQRYGRLTVLARAGTNSTGAQWLVKCDCGTIKKVTGRFMRRGLTKSCGCLRKETGTEQLRKLHEQRRTV